MTFLIKLLLTAAVLFAKRKIESSPLVMKQFSDFNKEEKALPDNFAPHPEEGFRKVYDRPIRYDRPAQFDRPETYDRPDLYYKKYGHRYNW